MQLPGAMLFSAITCTTCCCHKLQRHARRQHQARLPPCSRISSGPRSAWPSPAGSARPAQRRSLLAARAASGDAGSGDAGELEIQVAVPLSSPQGSQLAYILTSGEANGHVLFEPAVRTYLQELQAERDSEAAMEAEAAADAAAEAAAAAAAGGGDAASSSGGDAASSSGGSSSGGSSSGGSGGGMDVEDTWSDGALMGRIRALREAERGHVVADVLYLEAVRRLASAGLALLPDPRLLAPGRDAGAGYAALRGFTSAERLAAAVAAAEQQQQPPLLSPAVLDAVQSYLASTFCGGDARMMAAASPPATPLSVDRLQAARLYLGMVEFGYFAAGLEAACIATGTDVGSDSAALIAYADGLRDEALRSLCAVRSADGWWGAVRHAGATFGLEPNEDPFDSFGLPYPQLALTISSIQVEPAANMLEHFNPPGSAAKLAAKVADKQARGWSGDAADGLPDADLITFELGLFQRMLLEAAVFGAVLHGVEAHVERAYSYQLACRREREAQQAAAPQD